MDERICFHQIYLVNLIHWVSKKWGILKKTAVCMCAYVYEWLDIMLYALDRNITL